MLSDLLNAVGLREVVMAWAREGMRAKSWPDVE
jgi:hypothetical protein